MTLPASIRDEYLPICFDEEDAEKILKDKASHWPAKVTAARYLIAAGYKNKEMAKLGGFNRFTASQLRRVATLPETMVELWHKNRNIISFGHMRALMRVSPKKRKELFENCLRYRYSVRRLEQLVSESPVKDLDVAMFEAFCSEHMGFAVKIRHNPKGHGTVTLQYISPDDLNDKMAALGVPVERFNIEED